MLVSGVIAGIAAGIAFGGDWRRLGTFTLRWWPLLVIASALRLWTFFFPNADFLIYVIGLFGIGLVAALNSLLPGAALIALSTFANVLVVVFNTGMPTHGDIVLSVGTVIATQQRPDAT